MPTMRAHEIISSGYNGWEVSEASRAQLADVFPPKFSEFIGHHITLKMGVKSDAPLPEATSFQVVGYACNEDGLEALVVSVDGDTTRPDGKTYHITWSLDREAGFKPFHSNALISSGWTQVNPINISATARFFKSN
jgi:hypothetical protein